MSDPLIELPQEPHWTPAWKRGVAGFFLFWIVGSLLLDLAWPAPLPTLIGAERGAFEQRKQQAQFSDGTLAEYLVYRQRLQSRTRQALGPVYAATGLRLLGMAPERLVVGPRGWLFMRNRVSPRKAPPEETTAGAAVLISAFERRMSAHGTKVFVVPVPRKAVVVPEELPADLDPRADIEAALGATLTRFGVQWVDLNPVLAEFPTHQRYWKYDTHWSYAARQRVGRVLIEAANELAPEPDTELVAEQRVPAAGMLQMAGVTPGSWCESWFDRQPDTGYQLRRNGEVLEPNRASLGRLALSGTSFSEELASTMTHFAGEPVWDGSSAGRPFMGSLVRLLLLASKHGFPEVLWYEFPLHQVFSVGKASRVTLGSWYGTVFAWLPATQTSALNVDVAIPAPGEPLTLARNRLITSGEALAYVRVRGAKVPTVETRWSCKLDDFALDLAWLAGRKELLIPILDVGRLGTGFELRAQAGSEAVQPVSFEIVTDLDLEGGVAGSLDAEKQLARFPALPVQRHDGLLLELVAGPKLQPLTVRARSSDGSVVEWSFEFRRKAQVLLGLGALAGTELVQVEISGASDSVDWRSALFARHWRSEP